jgi:hypothetical protein
MRGILLVTKQLLALQGLSSVELVFITYKTNIINMKNIGEAAV